VHRRWVRVRSSTRVCMAGWMEWMSSIGGVGGVGVRCWRDRRDKWSRCPVTGLCQRGVHSRLVLAEWVSNNSGCPLPASSAGGVGGVGVQYRRPTSGGAHCGARVSGTGSVIGAARGRRYSLSGQDRWGFRATVGANAVQGVLGTSGVLLARASEFPGASEKGSTRLGGPKNGALS
jgi:hypothetical protein